MNYTDFYKHIKKGDIVWANDSIFEFVVKEINFEMQEIIFQSKSTGKLLNNKGMHVRGIHANIPFLFEKDKKLIELANKHHLDFVGLSFVRDYKDVLQAKELIDDTIKIISKIETKSSVDNLANILKEVEYILIDRGDLSTEVGLLQIPYYQNFIIKEALAQDKKIFLATQFLKSMEHNPIATFPEVIDLYNTLKNDIYGIQMSEETAVGKYPRECLETIKSIQLEIEKEEIQG
jgi:pyruvate kinase